MDFSAEVAPDCAEFFGDSHAEARIQNVVQRPQVSAQSCVRAPAREIGHLPSALFEPQLRAYFEQFGEVRRRARVGAGGEGAGANATTSASVRLGRLDSEPSAPRSQADYAG